MKSFVIVTLLAGLSALLTGCASPASPSAMIPADFAPTSHHHGSVNVKVAGGHETDPMWKSDVSSEDFATALTAALTRSDVFSSVVDANSDYRLEVQLIKVITPNVGFNMTVTMVTEWRLIRAADSAELCDEYITTDFTATVGDAFVAITRIKVANEGAARANIAEGLQRLSALKLE